MATESAKAPIPFTKAKEDRDYLKYSLELLNVSMRNVIFRALLSTVVFFGLLWFLRTMPFSERPPLDFIITLFLERGLLQYASTISFFVGFWFLILKLPKIEEESNAFSLVNFPEMKSFPIGADEAAAITKQVRGLTGGQRNLVIVRRVETAIQRLLHTRSTAEVHDVLNTMSEVDRGIADASYRTVRFSVWFIPVLGFMGTVMGISKAISGFAEVVKTAGGLGLDSLKPALAGATYNLGVAFDTTLLALALSAMLVLLMHHAQRKEEVFLSGVDEFCVTEILNKLYIPNPDTQQLVDGLETVSESIKDNIGGLKKTFEESLSNLSDSLDNRDAAALEKLFTQIQVQFDGLMAKQDKNEKIAQKRFSDLMEKLGDLIDKGKPVEEFVVGLGGVANLEKILRENQETLKTLRESSDNQQLQVADALKQNEEALSRLLAPLEELAKGIKIRVGE